MSLNKFCVLFFLLLGKSAFAADDWKDGDFTGYLRAGAGTSAAGTQNCYYLGNGDGHGYRLGNECDSYAEFGYSKVFAKADDGVSFIGHLMVNDYSGNSSYSGNPQLSQIFVSMAGWDWLGGGEAWIGERYYERPDIHWMDLQYINLNGTGGGIDNIPTTWGGKFSYALFKDNDTDNLTTTGQNNTPVKTGPTTSNAAVRNDLLYRGLPFTPNGTLDFIAGLITPTTSDPNRHMGYNAHIFYNKDLKSFIDGRNTFGVQFGAGPGTGLGAPAASFNPLSPTTTFGSTNGTVTAGPDNVGSNRMGQSGSTLLDNGTTRLRLLDAVWIQHTPRYSQAWDVIYEGVNSPILGGTSSWYSVGTRQAYAFGNHFKLQAEVGLDVVTYPQAGQESLVKYTLAPTLTLGPQLFDRPELRFFITQANWNGAATNTININNYNNTGALGTATADMSIGLQVEAWWGKTWF
jgi:maltoporin